MYSITSPVINYDDFNSDTKSCFKYLSGDEILVQFVESSGRGLSKHLTNDSPVLGVPIRIFIVSSNQNLSSTVATQVLFLLANQKAVYMMGSGTANHLLVDLPKTWILL